MTKWVYPLLIAGSVLFLSGCGASPTPATPSPGLQKTSLRGNGAVVIGKVVRIDKDGNLVTDIPTRWMGATLTEPNPFTTIPVVYPEGQRMNVVVGGKVHPALWTCNGPGGPDGDWGVDRIRDTKTEPEYHDSPLVIVCNGRSAAKESGVGVGFEVMIIKTQPPD